MSNLLAVVWAVDQSQHTNGECHVFFTTHKSSSHADDSFLDGR